MIRGLYNHLDQHLKDLNDKFKKDEIALRNEVDSEIKMQMLNKLKELKYTQTELYGCDFLYELGKLTIYRKLDSSPQIPKIITYDLVTIKNIDKNICSYEGFFDNISKLNDDVELKREDEYIVGIMGNIKFNSYNNGQSNANIELKVISNYLNYYTVINQYNSSAENYDKKFNERFQLKCIRKNNMKMFDEQIDIIHSIFYKVNILITNTNNSNINTCQQLDTSYDLDIYNSIALKIERANYNEKLKKYNFQTLPKECCDRETPPEEKFSCCQKCYTTLNNKNSVEFIRRETVISSAICTKDRIIRDVSNSSEDIIFNQFSLKYDFNILRQNTDMNSVLFIIFEKSFNDFWSDKIHEISNDGRNDISMADLIEHKDETIENLSGVNKTLNQRIKVLEQSQLKYKKSSEYEKTLHIQIKTLKSNIITMEKKIDKLTNDKEVIQLKYTVLKNKLGSLME